MYIEKQVERLKICLPELADALRKSDMLQGYVDLRTGKVILLAGEMSEEETLEHVFSIEEDWQRYVMLPDIAYEEDRSAMRSFANLQQGEARTSLLECLEGARSSSRFCRKVKELGLWGQWKSFQRLHFIAVARSWCEENGIEYEGASNERQVLI